MNGEPYNESTIKDAANNIKFSDIFLLDDIQHLQDLFSVATGVASIITYPDGTPITKPSNFCRLCKDIIRNTEKGLANCMKSDALIGRHNSSGPIIRRCMSAGLWDAGSSITVGGKHIANWLIGQVRNEDIDDLKILKYADEIGAKKADFIEALNEVPVMSSKRFNKVSEMLFAFVNALSESAYLNLQLKMQIKERENATILLRNSEERFQLLFNEAPLGYQSLDINGYIINVNQKWLNTLGYSRQEVIGKWFGDFLSPDSQEGFRQRFPIFKADGKIHSEFEMVHKSGKILFIAFDGRIAFNLNREFKQTHCILQDITDRKQAEEEIKLLNAELEQRVKQRTLQLENSNKELDAFAYSVSHNLRSPLRGIDGWSLALLEDYNHLLDEQGRTYLFRVRNEAQQMANLIDDLLKLSRVTSVELKQENVDLTVLVQTIANQFMLANPKRKFEFIIEPGIVVQGDISMLQIVLTNLLDNACKYTGPKPFARIEFGKLEIEGKQTFFIRDNGVGFNPDNAKKIFGAFQRMHKPSEFPGSGIGLATVHRIISRHGGRIWAESKPGEGATFYFTIM